MKRKLLLYVILAASLVVFGGAAYGQIPRYCAILSLYFVISATLKFFKQKDVRYLFKAFPITANWIYFQSPFLLFEKVEYGFRIIPEDYELEMAIFPALGLVIYYYTFDLIDKIGIKPIFHIKKIGDEAVFQQLLSYFLFFSYAINILGFVAPSFIFSISNVLPFIPFLGGIVVGLLIIYNLRFSNANPVINILGGVHVLLDLYIRISSTLFAYVLFIFVCVFLAYVYEAKRIPYKTILILLMIGLPFYQVRKLVRYYNAAGVSNFDSFLYFIDRTYQNEGISGFINIDEDSGEEPNRFEGISFFGQIVYEHEILGREFWGGKTFYWLPIVIVPRVIFPSKPTNLLATEIATDYGLRGATSTASMNFPQLMEGYINFGFIGVLIISAFQGVFFCWVASKIAFGQGDFNFVVALSLIKQFMHMEGNITLVFGACLQVLFFFFIFRRLIAKKWVDYGKSDLLNN